MRRAPSHMVASLAGIAAVALAIVPRAAAHGGRPQTQSVLFASDDPQRIVVAATFGLLTSDDAGATWSWTCQESMPDGVPGVVQPSVLVTGDRLLVAGTFGLVRGARAGCGWDREPALADHYVADVTRDRDGAVLAITGDSGSAENGIYESTDEGESFRRIGAPFPVRFLSERVRVAPSDPRRIYVSGQAFVEGTTDVRGILLRSDDRGASWTELSVELVPGDRLVRVVAVEPEDPDVAWIVVQGSEHDRILRAGAAGTSVVQVVGVLADPMPYQRPFAFARAPDGTIWFGNTREGLAAMAPDGTVTLIDKYLAATCAVVHGDRLYVCGDGFDDGFALASTGLDAYAPEPIIQYGAIERRLCDTYVDCLCTTWWDDFQIETIRADGGLDASAEALDGGTCTLPDAGLDAGRALDGGGPDAGTAAPPSAAGCSCRVAPRAPPAGWLALPALALAITRRRWRRRELG